ncbi:MAG: cofactor-independent phosphoglycerate mutase [Desulfobacteraceae bacterium]|jgi:2,3-bisphosphoglycerate-independent phosphoglycerate mutase|nr:MAG: cofactor-independent phosphoglycerate mutase [Desulfobacteraceae bacterium]
MGKYVFMVGDGMADYPLSELGGKTPLEAAETPNMDRIAACRIGLVQTIPEGMQPGSDVANLSLLGYNPGQCVTGRGPLEAASLGVSLGPDEVAFRMNLVTLDFRSPAEILMVSHSSGDISTPEGRELVEELKGHLILPGISMYSGVAYRHLLVWDKGPCENRTIPPHDVLGRNMAEYLAAERNDPVTAFMRDSWEILKDHPINRKRKAAGLKEANSAWLWGQGKAPKMIPLTERFGISGGVISAVDLLKGIGVYAGLKPIHVEGATGYLDTNYLGKGEAAVAALEDMDFVFVHVEAPDEASHNGNWREKIQAIENFDRMVVGIVLEGVRDIPGCRIMVVSDHLTPIIKRTHSPEPTPFGWASTEELALRVEKRGFNEKAAEESGLFFSDPMQFISSFLGRI